MASTVLGVGTVPNNYPHEVTTLWRKQTVSNDHCWWLPVLWGQWSGEQSLAALERLPWGRDADPKDVKESWTTRRRRSLQLKFPESSQLQTHWKITGQTLLYDSLPLNWNSSPLKYSLVLCPVTWKDWLNPGPCVKFESVQWWGRWSQPRDITSKIKQTKSGAGDRRGNYRWKQLICNLWVALFPTRALFTFNLSRL